MAQNFNILDFIASIGRAYFNRSKQNNEQAGDAPKNTSEPEFQPRSAPASASETKQNAVLSRPTSPVDSKKALVEMLRRHDERARKIIEEK